jgi:hypothetical protein
MAGSGWTARAGARRRLRVCAVASAAALLVGGVVSACGGSSGNGLTSKSPEAIVTAATAAFDSAKSVHLSGWVENSGSKITLDLDLASGKGASGTMAIGGLSFRIIEIGQSLYLNADTAFWTHYANAAAAQLFAGKWLKIPSSNSAVASFSTLADFSSFKQLLSSALSKATPQNLTKGSTTTVDGQQAVPISEKGSQKSTLYVATAGRPYPIEVEQANSGSIVFDHYNESVSLKGPANAIAYP